MLTVRAATISFLTKNNMSYNNFFSSVYDTFTDSVGYAARGEYICKILKQNGICDGAVLDVACGTGSISEILLQNGYEVVATDISTEMLNIAAQKLAKYKDKALLLCQDMCELDLYGTVDAAVCCLDSINHLIDEEDVFSAFSRISLFMRPDGIFVFDVNTVHKHRDVLSDKTFVYEDDGDAFLVWQNSECDEDDIVEMYIDVFKKTSVGTYERQSETVIERAYSEELLVKLLQRSGFEVVGIYGDLKQEKPEKDEERIYFVARKK